MFHQTFHYPTPMTVDTVQLRRGCCSNKKHAHLNHFASSCDIANIIMIKAAAGLDNEEARNLIYLVHADVAASFVTHTKDVAVVNNLDSCMFLRKTMAGEIKLLSLTVLRKAVAGKSSH